MRSIGRAQARAGATSSVWASPESEDLLSSRQMTGSQPDLEAALQRLQVERRYFSIAVYRIEGEYAVRIASAGATCGQCDKVHVSAGNIGQVARTGIAHAVDDVSKDASYKTCFSQVKSEAVVPIVIAGTTIGVIDAESETGPIELVQLEDFARKIGGLVQAV